MTKIFMSLFRTFIYYWPVCLHLKRANVLYYWLWLQWEFRSTLPLFIVCHFAMSSQYKRSEKQNSACLLAPKSRRLMLKLSNEARLGVLVTISRSLALLCTKEIFDLGACEPITCDCSGGIWWLYTRQILASRSGSQTELILSYAGRKRSFWSTGSDNFQRVTGLCPRPLYPALHRSATKTEKGLVCRRKIKIR